MKKEPKRKKAELSEPFCRHAFETAIELLRPLPRVLVSRLAHDKMHHLVDLSKEEIGWLGTCVPLGNDFLIEDVFLFKQGVNATETEITTEGLAKVGQELIDSRPDGVEICNKLRFWGHSHVRMSTSPSTQDDDQMESFRDSEHDFFIRGILNKDKRMEFTIYLYSQRIKILDAEWLVHEPVDQSLRQEIEAEIKAKVFKKTYPAYQGGGKWLRGRFRKFRKGSQSVIVSDNNHFIGSFDGEGNAISSPSER